MALHSFRLFSTLVAVCSSLLCSASLFAQDTSVLFEANERPIPASPASEQDVDMLDLNHGKDSAASSGAGECSASLPSGSPVGQWPKQAGDACSTRLWALSQYGIARGVNLSLWCDDPGAYKAASRQGALRRAAEHKALVDAGERFLKTGPVQISDSIRPASAWLSTFLQSPIKASAATAGAAPFIPYYDASSEASLSWDAREAFFCSKQNASLPSELDPALSAFALGKISTPLGSCDALAVEMSVLTGRRSLSRVAWIASKCPGFLAPEPAALAAAIAAGTLGAQAWQDGHFKQWLWQGAPPREARGRSAEGR